MADNLTFAGALQKLLEAPETPEDALTDAVGAAARAALADGLVIDVDLLGRALKELRRARRFRSIELLAEALEEAGLDNADLLKHHAQALIERGAYLPAAGLLSESRAASLRTGDARTEADSWGLEGRIFKDLYLQSGPSSGSGVRAPRAVRERLLQRSLNAYNWIYARDPKNHSNHYQGVNLMAVTARALADGVPFQQLASPADIASNILASIAKRAKKAAEGDEESKLADWDFANAAEANALLGNWEEATRWINRYLEVNWNNAFNLNGTLRQFVEVWGVRDDDPVKGPIVTALRGALMAAQSGGVTLTQKQAASFKSDFDTATQRFKQVDKTFALENRVGAPAPAPTPEAGLQNERTFGVDGPVKIDRINQIMARAKAVGRVNIARDSGDSTIGTGFLLPGAYVDKSLAKDTLFVTNAHVVSDQPDRDGAIVRPGEDVSAAFDLAPELGKFDLDQLIWCSGQHEHDMSIFRVDAKTAEIAKIIEVAKGLPALVRKSRRPGPNNTEEEVVSPGKVYVIGHPLGQELSISLNDNDLIDQENIYGSAPGPEPRRIHYRAPTEKGNSGSPVFNSNNLELIGVHHRGGWLQRLAGKEGNYKVNEGMWIRPAINQMRAFLGLKGDMFGG